MEDTVKLFLAGLKVYAKRKKINQTQLGKTIGRGQTTISDYFKGNTRPEDWMIKKWVEDYNVDFDDLVGLGRQVESKEDKGSATPQKADNESGIVALHKSIIENFIDKKKGLAANEALLIIEKHNRLKFIDLVAEIEKIALKIQMDEEVDESDWDIGKASNQD